MLRVIVTPTTIEFSPPFPAELRQFIDSTFSCPHPNAFHIIKHHRENVHEVPMAWCSICNWDGQYRFLKGNSLPIGFLQDVVELLPDVEVIDTRTKPPKQYNWHLNIELRDYQKEIIENLPSNGVISAATGSGKTLIAAGIICKLGLPAIILVPTKVISVQFVETFRKHTDCPIGIIGSGKWEEAPVNIALTQTLVRNKEKARKLLHSKDVVIVDEFHFAAAKTWQEIMNMCTAYYRFGMSATPFRPDDLGDMILKSLVGNVFAEIPTEELQEQGYLCDTDIRMIRLPCKPPRWAYDKERQEGRPTTFGEKYRAVIVENHLRNAIIADLALHHYNLGQKVLINVAWKEHVDQLLPFFDGVEVIVLSGEDSRKQTEEKRALFSSLDRAICLGTPVLDIGFDVPSVDVLILAGGGKYRGRQQQRLGRGLRVHPGKEKLIVYDIFDDDKDTKKQLFRKHSLARAKTYKSLGQEVKLFESLENAKKGLDINNATQYNVKEKTERGMINDYKQPNAKQ